MDSGCLTPTQVKPGNSALCESLASKVANFTSQFFGLVTKTDLLPSGVSWTLGCGLQDGLPTNPRGYSEGVSCYFSRLLFDEIQALRGDKGEAGVPGSEGRDAVSAVTSDFSQPALQDTITISVLPTLVLLPGLLVFIQQSGEYRILSNDGVTIQAQLVAAVSGAPATISAGNVIIPISPAGNPIQGKQGLPGAHGSRGVQGPDGEPGLDSNPSVNGTTTGVGKNDFIATIVGSQPTPVIFAGDKVDINLPVSGTFYIVGTTQTLPGTSAVLFLALVSFAVVVIATQVTVAAYNTLAEATAALQPGQEVQEKIAEVLDTTFQATPYEPRLLQTFFSTVGPKVIRLYVNQDSHPQVQIKASATSFNWFQIA